MKSAKRTSRKTIGKRAKGTAKSKPGKSAGAGGEEIRALVESLQINQVELEHQNQELRIVEQELEASRNKFVNLFDFSPIPYFNVDRDGIIKEINLSGGQMLGSARNRSIGKNIRAFITPEYRNIFSGFMRAVFDSATKQSCTLEMMNKDKRMFHVLLQGVRSDDTLEAEQRCLIALIDLTEYKKLEDSHKALLEELKGLKRAKD